MGRKAKKSGSGKKPVALAPSAADGSDSEDAEQVEDQEERVELIADDGDASRAFKSCLVALFQRFDVDKDRLLSEAELKVFSREANENEREFSADEFEEMRDCFDWTEKGPNGVGGLTLRGWLQMYQTQTGAEPEETWRDLHQLGYNNQLELVSAVPKAMHPRSASLRAALDRFVVLASGDDVEAFVKGFVATDIDEEDRVAFAEDLKKDGSKQLLELLAELRCCASGEGVFKIEEKKEKEGAEQSPVTIHFHSPAPGCEKVDRAVVFVRDGGDWRAEG